MKNLDSEKCSLINNLAAFVLKYRRGKAFVGWNYVGLVYHFYDGLAVFPQTVAYSINEEGLINGVVLTRPQAGKILHVNHVLTTEPGALKKLILIFKERFPDYIISANRDEKFRLYNTTKLVNKIISYG